MLTGWAWSGNFIRREGFMPRVNDFLFICEELDKRENCLANAGALRGRVASAIKANLNLNPEESLKKYPKLEFGGEAVGLLGKLQEVLIAAQLREQ